MIRASTWQQSAQTGRRANKVEKQVNGKAVKPYPTPWTIRLLVASSRSGVPFLRRLLASSRAQLKNNSRPIHLFRYPLAMALAKGASFNRSASAAKSVKHSSCNGYRLQRVNAPALGKGVFSPPAGRCQKKFRNEIEKKRVGAGLKRKYIFGMILKRKVFKSEIKKYIEKEEWNKKNKYW